MVKTNGGNGYEKSALGDALRVKHKLRVYRSLVFWLALGLATNVTIFIWLWATGVIK